MNTRRILAVPLLLLAPVLMAPTCSGAEQNAGIGADTSQKITALICTSDGYPVGIGYARAGDRIYSCDVKVYDAQCECPDVLEERTFLLAVPGASLTPNAAATVCWGESTPNPDPALYLVERSCTDIGVYQPGPEGPQSFEDRHNEG